MISVATKWGRSSPVLCFAHVRKPSSRRVQPQHSHQLPFTAEVNGTVNSRVNGVVHALFTPFLWVSSRGERPFRTR
jgi:hypothetical protein